MHACAKCTSSRYLCPLKAQILYCLAKSWTASRHPNVKKLFWGHTHGLVTFVHLQCLDCSLTIQRGSEAPRGGPITWERWRGRNADPEPSG